MGRFGSLRRALPGLVGALPRCALVLVAGCTVAEPSVTPTEPEPPLAAPPEPASAQEPARPIPAALMQGSCGQSELERRVRGALADAQLENASSPKVAEILGDLAAVCRDEKQIGDAIELMEHAILVWDVIGDAEQPQLARALVILGEMQREAGSLDAAERAYKRALTITEANLGTNHPNVGVCVLALGGLYYQENRLDEAEAMYRRAVEVSERNASASSDTDIGLSLRNLALVLRRQGRDDAARAILQRSISVFEQRLGPDAQVVQHLQRELERGAPASAP